MRKSYIMVAYNSAVSAQNFEGWCKERMDQSFIDSISNFFSQGGFLIILLVVMFAVMIIPQRKRDKKIKKMLSELKPGDRVRTIGGIYGTIGSVKDDVITLLVGPDKVRLVFARGAIATVEDSPVENTLDEQVTNTESK